MATHKPGCFHSRLTARWVLGISSKPRTRWTQALHTNRHTSLLSKWTKRSLSQKTCNPERHRTRDPGALLGTPKRVLCAIVWRDVRKNQGPETWTSNHNGAERKSARNKLHATSRRIFTHVDVDNPVGGAAAKHVPKATPDGLWGVAKGSAVLPPTRSWRVSSSKIQLGPTSGRTL